MHFITKSYCIGAFFFDVFFASAMWPSLEDGLLMSQLVSMMQQ
jgi:hypothetical protein